MNMKKLPLSQRLRCLKSGHVAHPEFISGAILHMAETPLRIYLRDFNEQRERLFKLLQLTPQEQQTMTYREAASRIAALPQDHAASATKILAAPLRKCYDERKHAYGTSNLAE